ncbi:MAG: M1 family aminopeptidase [Halieaceae bacterium]|nr:M1 family aminopeptidase [Halieaceae bacterium]
MFQRYRRLVAAPVRSLVFLLLAAGLCACDAQEVDVHPGVTEALAKHRAALLDEVRYRLHFAIPEDPAAAVNGQVTIDFKLQQAGQPLQVDFRAESSQIIKVVVNGGVSEYGFREEPLLIPADALQSGSNTLQIDFIAGAAALNRKPDFLYTLFVPDRARTAFPVFDQPDLKAHWELSLDIPASWTALSGGDVVNTRIANDRKLLQFATVGPLSSYLFSFVAGDFQTIARDVDGRTMRLLHRQDDADKVARNVDAIFQLHADAIAWLEAYTGIPLPFDKFDFALVPAHPYGGMEHVGAIQYRAESLWLDESPTDLELLNRASLIAHETAHMWFGNLVTMRWFNDVWTKEVFANFMAAKIVNPAFPEIDHELRFMVRHHPAAYAVDRTAGANGIRQPLPNLNQAGQLYGSIIYSKAPIMMRQLEARLGETAFREGIRRYLRAFSHANATWPELLTQLDPEGEADLMAWSEVWVNSPGRPVFRLDASAGQAQLTQRDPESAGRFWPQRFGLLDLEKEHMRLLQVDVRSAVQPLPVGASAEAGKLLFNADGLGYGLFPAAIEQVADWHALSPQQRAALLINAYEQMLETAQPLPVDYLDKLLRVIQQENNQLLLELALSQLRRVFWTLLPDSTRSQFAPKLESLLWARMLSAQDGAGRRQLFKAYASVALTSDALAFVEEVWSAAQGVDGLNLSERDLLYLAMDLAIKRPDRADAILAGQLARTRNPDERRRLEYLLPSLAPDPKVRRAFFLSLAQAENRATESWVLDALANLHHPLRVDTSEDYIGPGLALLEEIQATGDIFFPAGWLRASLANHHSERVVRTVDEFLKKRPDYNPQLRLKILQAADAPERALRLRQMPQG